MSGDSLCNAFMLMCKCRSPRVLRMCEMCFWLYTEGQMSVCESVWCPSHHGDILSCLLQFVFDAASDVSEVRQRELLKLCRSQNAGVGLKHLQCLKNTPLSLTIRWVTEDVSVINTGISQRPAVGLKKKNQRKNQRKKENKILKELSLC